MKSDLKNNSINYLEVDLAGDGRKLSDEVAEILSIDWDENLFLGTDLGSVLLFSFVSSKQTDCLVRIFCQFLATKFLKGKEKEWHLENQKAKIAKNDFD